MEDTRTKVLIITGNLTPMHNWRLVNEQLRQTMEASGHFLVKICEEFHGCGLETLEGYDLVLINYDGKAALTGHPSDFTKVPTVPLGETAENAICDYVESGHGVLFYHSSVTVEPPFSERYCDLVGHIINYGYKPHRDTGHTIYMHPENGSPICEGVEKVWKVCDDDFINWFDLKDDCTVVASIHDPVNSRDTPCFWTRQQGKGRVAACMLGHQQDTIRRLDFVRMFLRACDWAAHGEITVPMPDRDHDDNWMRSWPWYYTSPLGRAY